MGREWELSFRLGMRPWIAVAYSAPVAAATAVFLIYPIGQGSFSDGMPLGIPFALMLGNKYLSTRLNGGTLGSSQPKSSALPLRAKVAFSKKKGFGLATRKATTNQSGNPGPSGPENDPQLENLKKRFAEIIKNPVNPVLSNTYFLSKEQGEFLQNIAINAICEALSLNTTTLERINDSCLNLKKKKLNTYNETTHFGKAGVYLMKNIETGKIYVGQTRNLYQRAEEHLARAQYVQTNRTISADFTLSKALQEAFLDLTKPPREVLLFCFVYSWPFGQKRSDMTSGVTQQSQYEMNFLESTLIYALQQAEITYNVSLPKALNKQSMPTKAPKKPKGGGRPVDTERKPPETFQIWDPNKNQQVSTESTPIKKDGKYFYSIYDYSSYVLEKNLLARLALPPGKGAPKGQGIFVKRSKLRNNLRKTSVVGSPEYDPDNHYLTQDELDVVMELNLWEQYVRTVNPDSTLEELRETVIDITKILLFNSLIFLFVLIVANRFLFFIDF